MTSRLRKNAGTDGSVHSTDSHLTDSTFAVGDRFVCPRVFPQPARNWLLLLCGAASAALAPLYGARPPLPAPLKLPPGLIQTLQVDKEGSYMGDAVRIPDCPKAEDAPFFVCGNVLFGGLGLWNTHLTGPLQIRFTPPVNNVSHFEITHPFNLTGDDVVLRAPQFYAFDVTNNVILDQFNQN